MKKPVHKNKSFSFKQFTIQAGNSGMPVSTDGVMLGAWVQCADNGHILDIGTGTGLLTLMCAQRFPESHITALDIEPIAIDAARLNCSHSPWTERITILHRDVLSFEPKHRFSTIICNPPYFNTGQSAQRSQRAIARHAETLPHSQLLHRCYQLLLDDGKANFVLPITEGNQFINMARAQGWHLSRLCRVQPSIKKPVHRLLIELTKHACDTDETQLIIQTDTGYGADFIQLTHEFYLKM
ncbi:tRNA1(Val) (adenine(37)-N6)-methyltransferase [Vibrio sagamiensis]|uniref:tRNA1(Val) (adenine(37)-N6)-methyltransferase n=1 Tax=Vibrio sagamiensis TaxID=512650 RepID=UPI0003A35D6D|nr:methyltransferase [Vibrio sagamiensis]